MNPASFCRISQVHPSHGISEQFDSLPAGLFKNRFQVRPCQEERILLLQPDGKPFGSRYLKGRSVQVDTAPNPVFLQYPKACLDFIALIFKQAFLGDLQSHIRIRKVFCQNPGCLRCLGIYFFPVPNVQTT